MRILFFSHYFPPEGNAPASRTYEHCKRWVQADCQVTVVTCAPNCPAGEVYEGYRNRLWQREEMDGIQVIRVWTYIAPNKGTVRRILNYLSYLVSAVFFGLFLPKPDIIVATSPQFFCGWAGVVMKWVKRAPFILEIRDIWPESIAAVGAMKSRGILRFLEVLEQKMYASADHIVTVGEGYREVLAGKGVLGEKMSVIMNGIDLDIFRGQSGGNDIREHYGLDGQFVVSYVGTIGMASALDVVLRAATLLKAENCPGISFLLVGDGAARDELQRAAEEAGLDKVIFTGRQPKERIPDFIAASDVCLLHLRGQELFTTVMPSKFFEAAGMGRPVINGVAGFAADLVSRAGAGINIQPENEGELVEAIHKLATDKALYESCARQGLDYVQAHHDRNALAAEYYEIIQRVAEKVQTAGV